ncbi:MAG: CoA ester lyase [Alphaproteobacteria bacterium]|nr:CoA ester lyase [Alphaproteobacteria bacterium]
MSDLSRPRRSALYLPASNARAVEKAKTLDCDVVILDLEDAVAPDMKVEARAAAVAAVESRSFGHRELIVRINGFGTPWMDDDMAAIVAAKPDGVQVPKIDTPQQAAEAVRMARDLPLWAMIESPRAVLAAGDIAGVEGVFSIVGGLADLAKDLKATPGPDRTELLYAIQAILVAARAHGRIALDGVHTDIHDLDGLARAAAQGAAMGYDGKTVVHPSHIEAANRAFSPSPQAIEDARGLLAAHEAAKAEGRGVTTFKGKMVEVLHVAEAKRMLAFADAIAARG